jgi:hypothetical protein
VHLGQRHFETGTVTVLPFERFCVPCSGNGGMSWL